MSELAHHADMSAAVDDAETLTREQFTELACRGCIFRTCATG